MTIYTKEKLLEELAKHQTILKKELVEMSLGEQPKILKLSSFFISFHKNETALKLKKINFLIDAEKFVKNDDYESFNDLYVRTSVDKDNHTFYGYESKTRELAKDTVAYFLHVEKLNSAQPDISVQMHQNYKL